MLNSICVRLYLEWSFNCSLFAMLADSPIDGWDYLRTDLQRGCTASFFTHLPVAVRYSPVCSIKQQSSLCRWTWWTCAGFELPFPDNPSRTTNAETRCTTRRRNLLPAELFCRCNRPDQHRDQHRHSMPRTTTSTCMTTEASLPGSSTSMYNGCVDSVMRRYYTKHT